MEPTPPVDNSEPRGLQPPQFGLRTLLWIVGGLCVIFAVLAAIGAAWSAVVIFILLLIGGHVAGNALGTSLRQDSARARRSKVATPLPGEWHDSPRPVPSTRLQQKQRMGFLFLLAGILGGVGGGIAGGYLLISVYGDQISWTSLAGGTVSATLLGGMLGCFTFSFIGIAARTWHEAVRDHKREQRKEQPAAGPIPPGPRREP